MTQQRKLALLALIPVTGGLGIHKFCLGYTRSGVIHLFLGITLLGVVVGMIEGVIYLTMPESQFLKTYVTNKRTWF